MKTSSANESTASKIDQTTQTNNLTSTTAQNDWKSKMAVYPTRTTIMDEEKCCGMFSREGGQYANGIFIKQILNEKVAYIFDSFAIWYEIASQYWIAGLLSDCVEGNFRGFNIAADQENICPVDANWMKYDNGKWTIETEIKLKCFYDKKSVKNDMYTTKYIRN